MTVGVYAAAVGALFCKFSKRIRNKMACRRKPVLGLRWSKLEEIPGGTGGPSAATTTGRRRGSDAENDPLTAAAVDEGQGDAVALRRRRRNSILRGGKLAVDAVQSRVMRRMTSVKDAFRTLRQVGIR